MKTILLPTDFSETAKNALYYAMGFARQTGIRKIVLFNAYQPSPVSDPVLNSIDFYEIEAFKKISEENLQKLKAEISLIGDLPFSVECIGEFNSVLGGIRSILDRMQIDLIILGLNQSGGIDGLLGGNNGMHIAKQSPIPVIAVPLHAGFVPIQKILLACDLKEVIETTPVSNIKAVLDTTGAKLYLFHETHADKRSTPGMPFEGLMLNTLFQVYQPEFTFSENADFGMAVNEVAVKNGIDLLINIPKKYGMLSELFRHSHTRNLLLHTRLPVMLVHN